jgi:hypothetical protein
MCLNVSHQKNNKRKKMIAVLQALSPYVKKMKRVDRIRLRAVSKDCREIFEKPPTFYTRVKYRMNTDDFSVIRMIIKAHKRVPHSYVYFNPKTVWYFNAYMYLTYHRGQPCLMSSDLPIFCQQIYETDNLENLIYNLKISCVFSYYYNPL